MGSIGKEVPTRSSRIPDAERQAILDRLDAADAENPAKQRRGLPRVGYRKSDVNVRIYHPGGTSTACVVATRNLSEGGISFLYNGYLHGKTKVEVVLQRRLGGQDMIAGTVQHCALIHRTIHLVGIKFASKIFPKLYLDPADWAALGETTAVNPQTLQGTVLHLDDEELDRVLLGHFLKGTKLGLLSAATLEEAKALLAKNPVDCLLLDLNMKETTGEKAVPLLREAGYTGPIAALTAETDATRLKAIQGAGVVAVLGKPYDAASLLSLISTSLATNKGDSDALISTMADQEAMRPLIVQYVQKLQAMAGEIRKKFDAGDLAGVRQHYMSIRGTGKSFGFAVLSDIASDAVQSLDENRAPQDRLMNLQRLEQACRRLKAA